MKLILTVVMFISLLACTKETSNAEDPKGTSNISTSDMNEFTSMV